MSRIPGEHCPRNPLSRLTVQDLLKIRSCETPNSGVGTISNSLVCSWVASSSLNRRVCVWSYCIFLCCPQLISLRLLLFYERNGGWVNRRKAGMSDGRDHYDPDAFYERRIKRKYNKNFLINMFMITDY